jgi:uncharacterized phage protein (TIGR02220 family)
MNTINEIVNPPKQKAEGGINEIVNPPKQKAEHNNTINNTINIDRGNALISERVIRHLNLKVGTNYNYKRKETIQIIGARLKEKFTEADFIKVIDNKCRDWLNDDAMRKYLRPSTLFRSSKFESYLQQKNKVLTQTAFGQFFR